MKQFPFIADGKDIEITGKGNATAELHRNMTPLLHRVASAGDPSVVSTHDVAHCVTQQAPGQLPLQTWDQFPVQLYILLAQCSQVMPLLDSLM